MTAEPENTTNPASPSSPATERYAGFAELRTAHLDLRASFPDLARVGLEPGVPSATVKLRQFLAMAQRTGTLLVDPSVRKAAQGILDYWCAELAGLSDATKEDFIPLTLAPPAISTLTDIEQTAGRSEGIITQRKEDQRVLIRLSGMARQWRNADRQPGYLLTGEALEQAHHFAQQDPDLLEFVEASQAAEDARKLAEAEGRRRRRFYWSTVGIVVTIVGGLLYWQFYTLPQTTRSWLRQIAEANSGKTQTNKLWWLARVQPWTPPYDFSGTPKLANIPFPELSLYAPNFSGVTFSKVEFPRAKLPAASFSGASFSFDGGGRNDFGEADLRQAQFRGARIADTSFKGADLYRASFDRAILCDVDFTGANLRATSFWAVTLNAGTEETLKTSPWWQALGWPWSEIEKLAPPRQTSAATTAADENLKTILKSSVGFKNDIQRPIESLKRSSAGTIDRALALNDLAWTDAVWGVDLTEPGDGNTTANNESSSDSCSASDSPADARRAAQQAVCIVDKLNREQQGVYTALLSNLRDTLAYVLMQSNAMPAAMAVFEQIDAKSLEEPETSFRYAIAQYATGGDKAAAIKRFRNAIEVGQYQPTHELQTLKDYIFPVQEFVDVLRNSSNKLWPTVAGQTGCPATKPPGAR